MDSTMARAPVRTTRRWKLPSFQSTSFILVFLGLPLAIYTIFVISPFVQAFYYSMTDWSGFSKSMNFVGLANYVALLDDPVFLKAVYNSIVLAVILPPLVIVLSLTRGDADRRWAGRAGARPGASSIPASTG